MTEAERQALVLQVSRANRAVFEAMIPVFERFQDAEMVLLAQAHVLGVMAASGWQRGPRDAPLATTMGRVRDVMEMGMAAQIKCSAASPVEGRA